VRLSDGAPQWTTYEAGTGAGAPDRRSGGGGGHGVKVVIAAAVIVPLLIVMALVAAVLNRRATQKRWDRWSAREQEPGVGDLATTTADRPTKQSTKEERRSLSLFDSARESGAGSEAFSAPAQPGIASSTASSIDLATFDTTVGQPTAPPPPQRPPSQSEGGVAMERLPERGDEEGRDGIKPPMKGSSMVEVDLK